MKKSVGKRVALNQVTKRSLVRSLKHTHHHGIMCPCSAQKNPIYFYRGMSPSQVSVPYFTQNRHVEAQKRWIGHTKFNHDLPSLSNDENFDYAFEMAGANIRYGKGVTKEVGMDLNDLGAKNVCVFTDPNLKNLPLFFNVLQSLQDNKIKFTVFDRVHVEPTDKSFKEAIAFITDQAQQTTSKGTFDAIVAIGGGSVMDTAKAANLYSCYPPENFLDYVNPPIGKGLPVPGPLLPLIAIPTTAGTGSETTGVAIFDYEAINAKTGIAHRRLKPTLGLIDPENIMSMPTNVAVASGFDVLCHALESYTAMPFNKRPRPLTPLLRPAYQGSNPISDVWSLKSLEMLAEHFVESVKHPDNEIAKSNMALASTYAGIGFGNAGVHLCHGMSYPVSSLAHQHSYRPEGYPEQAGAMIPHGMSVVLHAPAVFEWTAKADVDRHRKVAELLGQKVLNNVRDEDVGKSLADELIKKMQVLGVPNGLKATGFVDNDVPGLVQGALPQHRVLKLAPLPTGETELTNLYEKSMKIW